MKYLLLKVAAFASAGVLAYGDPAPSLRGFETKTFDEAVSFEVEGETGMRCVWPRNLLETMRIRPACSELADGGDDRKVPYACSGGQRVCCTVSDMKTPYFDKWGTCEKLGAEEEEDLVDTEMLVEEASTSAVAVETEDELDGPVYVSSFEEEEGWIGCVSPVNRLKRMGIRQACGALADDGDNHKVPYECSNGKRMCCTVSDMENPQLPGYGTCWKVEGEEGAKKPMSEA